MNEIIFATSKCPKCKGDMVLGHIGLQGLWIQGLSRLFGFGTDKRKIQTYRCIRCGFLESYAINSIS